MKCTIALLMSLVLIVSFSAFAEAPAWNDPSCYREDYAALSYDADEPVYVIGHKTPDTDTVCAAIAYADFRSQLGLNCEARVAGPINHETAFALNYFGVEVPPVLEDATGLQMILVDHSEPSQAISGITEAKICEIVDHHNFGNLWISNQMKLDFAPVGSTCSLIYRAYRECGLEIPVKIAGLLLSAILSDTSNLKYGATALDAAARAELAAIAGVEDPDAYYIELDTANLDYGGMTDEEIFFHDYKSYDAGDYSYGIGLVTFRGEELLSEYAERMAVVLEDVIDREPVNMLFAVCYDKNSGTQFLVCCGENALKAAELAEFGTTENGYIRIFPSVGRKQVLVPGLTQILENVNLDAEP